MGLCGNIVSKGVFAFAKCLERIVARLNGALLKAFNRAAVSLVLVFSLLFFSGGLVLVLDPGILKCAIGIVAGNWLPAFGTVLCFISGFMSCQAILLLVEAKTREMGKLVNDTELALDNQKTKYEMELSELRKQIGWLNKDRDDKENLLDMANREIADLRAENREMKMKADILHFESFEKALGLVLCKAQFSLRDWHHAPAEPRVKVSYAVSDKLKTGHRTYSRDYFIGYIQKRLSINFGVDLSKVRVSRSNGTITVYGVKAKPFGIESIVDENEAFLRYTAMFDCTDLPTDNAPVSQVSATEQDAKKELEGYKVACRQRFYDDVNGIKCRFDRAEDKEGSIRFGDDELKEWKEVREKVLKRKMFDAMGLEFKTMHENTVKLFRELLSILFKPLNCGIVINETDAMPDGAMSLKELCERHNVEQMKLLGN